MNYPKITEIIETKNENQDIKTLIFEHSEKMIPGQFFNSPKIFRPLNTNTFISLYTVNKF